MSVPSEKHRIKYQGDGTENAVYSIPFGFTSLASVFVLVEIDEGWYKQTLDVDYTINARATGHTGDVLTDHYAEGGWVIWIGDSPTAVIEITREEDLTQDFDLSDTFQTMDTTNFEKTVDKITMALSKTLKREGGNPETYDAQDRVILDVGQPVRWNDAARHTEVDILKDDTTGLEIPDTAAQAAGRFLQPVTFHPATPTVGWGTANETPPKYGVDRNALVDEGGGAYDWSGVNWIPPAPNDGSGLYMHTDGLGELEWKIVYEVPLELDGDDDDVLSRMRPLPLEWRSVPRELPVSGLSDTYDYSTRLWYTTGEQPSYEKGPKITYGSHFISVNIPEYVDGADFHTGGEGATDAKITCPTFSIAHNMTDDDDNDVPPDRVMIQVHNPRYTDALDDTYTVHWIAQVDDYNTTSGGITDTHINGRAIYMNVNVGLKDETSASVNPVDRYNLPLSSYSVKINWIAFLD